MQFSLVVHDLSLDVPSPVGGRMLQIGGIGNPERLESSEALTMDDKSTGHTPENARARRVALSLPTNVIMTSLVRRAFASNAEGTRLRLFEAGCITAGRTVFMFVRNRSPPVPDAPARTLVSRTRP